MQWQLTGAGNSWELPGNCNQLEGKYIYFIWEGQREEKRETEETVASLCAYSPCPLVSHYATHPASADRQPVWTSYCDNYRAVAAPHVWNACGEENRIKLNTHTQFQEVLQLNWPKTFAIFRIVFIIVKQLAVLLRIIRIIVGLFILRFHLKACRGLQILKARRFILVTKTTLDGLPAVDKTRET